MKKAVFGAIFLILVSVIISQFVSIFVVQPIGAVPEGRTLIISRLTNMNFIDSADAMCQRADGGVSLICRMAAMGAVLNKANVIARLPYSEQLYLFSTGGLTYSK